MPWFKVDDKLHDHRKARSAGATAMGVWVLAGSWAADNLTDGFVPASVLSRWGRIREANRLVEVGLWHADEQDGEQGWRFHEWDERQPTRAQKLAERAAKAEAGRIGGLRSGSSRREASAKQSASALVELPSRPVPTRPKDSSASADAEREFDEFWQLYPKRKAKGQAQRAFKTARKKAGQEVILSGLRRQLPELMRREEQYQPLPSTWLNGERWADEPDVVAAPAKQLRHVTEIPQPPDGLSDAEYGEWYRQNMGAR